MKYVDAGYVAALSTLFLYSLSLILRRRKLERAANLLEDRSPDVARPKGENAAVPDVPASPTDPVSVELLAAKGGNP